MLFLLPFLLLIAPVFATNSSLETATTSAEEAAPDQISSQDVIGWVVTFSATIPPAVGLFYTAMQLKNDSNARYIQTFRDIEKEIRDTENLHEYRSSAAGSEKREWWEVTFLNTMDKNAFLMQSKRYPKDLLDIFKNDFGYALHLIGNNESRKRDYSQVLILCRKKQWSPIELPK
jgi:hypothetical protein